MIPEIGILIGFYIITRCLELRAIADRSSGSKTMALLTIIVAVFVLIDLGIRSLGVL